MHKYSLSLSLSRRLDFKETRKNYEDVNQRVNSRRRSLLFARPDRTYDKRGARVSSVTAKAGPLKQNEPRNK